MTISQFNDDFKLIKVITAKKANISKNTWQLYNAVISQNNNSIKKLNYEFESNFDLTKILSIFENLSSLSLFELQNLKKDYVLLGYSTDKLDAYKYVICILYITLMTCIAAVLMLHIKHNKSKTFHSLLE